MSIVDDLSQSVNALYVQAGTGLLAIIVLLVVMNWFFHKLYWTWWIALHNSRKRELLKETEEGTRSGRRLLVGMALLEGWFDLAIADELHQLAGDTAQGSALGVLVRAGRRLIALTGTLMGGYADDLFNIFYRMEPQMIAGDGFTYGGEGLRSFQEQYGVLEPIEKIREEDNACTRASKKTVQVVRKPGASPLLFGKFLMSTTAFPALEDIADNLPTYTESVLACDMNIELAEACEELEKALRNAMGRELRSNAEMRKLLDQKIAAQNGICGICREKFTDYGDVVPDTSVPSVWAAHGGTITRTTFRPSTGGATARRDRAAAEEITAGTLAVILMRSHRRRAFSGFSRS